MAGYIIVYPAMYDIIIICTLFNFRWAVSIRLTCSTLLNINNDKGNIIIKLIMTRPGP